ncbi:MAG TPA: hypothetical protein VGL56_18815 [Fimbriimonadaceae bacterium]
MGILEPIFSPDNPAFWQAKWEITEFNFITGRWPKSYEEMVDVLPKKDVDKMVLKVDLGASSETSCDAEVTIKTELWPYHNPVQALRERDVNSILLQVLDDQHQNGKWPSWPLDGNPYPDKESPFDLKSTVSLHPTGHYCDVEFKTVIGNLHYSYRLRIKDSDKDVDRKY